MREHLSLGCKAQYMIGILILCEGIQGAIHIHPRHTRHTKAAYIRGIQRQHSKHKRHAKAAYIGRRPPVDHHPGTRQQFLTAFISAFMRPKRIGFRTTHTHTHTHTHTQCDRSALAAEPYPFTPNPEPLSQPETKRRAPPEKSSRHRSVELISQALMCS
jgi:hypothetical protein